MSASFGMNIRMSIYGESHGRAIGVVLDGLPPGIALDIEEIAREMARRAPGQSALTTSRKEKDAVEIESGFFEGRTAGTPLCARIANADQHSKDYSVLKDKMRPGHADYAGFVRYQGFNDYRGGGHFSGRITAPLVFAGAVAKQALRQEEIFVGAHILRVKDVEDACFDPLGESAETLANIAGKRFPVLDDAKGGMMREKILEARKSADSVGGVIEAMAIGLPAGLGAPYFDSAESCLSHALFSVPAVKAVEFGLGFALAGMTGSSANDELYYDASGRVRAYTNNNGGVTGGITDGMPLLFRVAVKPTPSIARPQRTVDVRRKENAELVISGRHDPCIVQRAVPVVEAVTAWVVWDLLLEARKWVR